MTSPSLHLAVAFDGTGAHPASWREPGARPAALFTPGYWIDLARTAERGLLDLLTIDDSFGLQSSHERVLDGRTDQVRGRLDAVMIASLVAPCTTRIGLVPTLVTTHTEPFHLASAISTLDWVSEGRAGWRPAVSSSQAEAEHVGRRQFPRLDPSRRDDPVASALERDLFEEAADVAHVMRRLWDSWEDDAVIRDVDTGRFVDRDKLHYVDFEGRFFSVRGPSIVPRPPQGNPLVVAIAQSQVPFEFAARSADVVVVAPADAAEVALRVDDVRQAEASMSRPGEPLRILADLVVFLDDTSAAAATRRNRLDELDGASFRSDAAVFVGTPGDLADELSAWRARGLDGFRLRPGVLSHDLDRIVDGVVPVLQQRGVFRTEYDGGLLRERFGLARLPSRYATATEAP